MASSSGMDGSITRAAWAVCLGDCCRVRAPGVRGCLQYRVKVKQTDNYFSYIFVGDRNDGCQSVREDSRDLPSEPFLIGSRPGEMYFRDNASILYNNQIEIPAKFLFASDFGRTFGCASGREGLWRLGLSLPCAAYLSTRPWIWRRLFNRFLRTRLRGDVSWKTKATSGINSSLRSLFVT